jgi:uncharacterized tellurite resistance protein B-like protein
MNLSHFITNHGKRVNRDHFLHLVQVAKADGVITETESNLLHRQGKKFGLTDPEIEQLIETEAGHNYHAPYSLEDKFYELYNIGQMILADKIVAETERKMMKRYAIAAGIKDNSIESLIDLLFKGIIEVVDEEDLFKEFKKIYF